MADIPEGDATKGAKIFKTKCAQCHSVEKVSGVGKVPRSHSFFFWSNATYPCCHGPDKRTSNTQTATTVIIYLRPELLETWLVLTSVNYHRNVFVSIFLNQWLVLTML